MEEGRTKNEKKRDRSREINMEKKKEEYGEEKRGRNI